MWLRHLFFTFLSTFIAKADISVFIERPWDGRVGDEVLVAARVASTLEIKSVIAEVEDRQGELVFSHMGAGPEPAFKDDQWHVVIGNELFLLDTEVPLSIETAGDSVVVSGTGVLESSVDLTSWIEVGPVEGIARIPRETAGAAKFYRLKR